MPKPNIEITCKRAGYRRAGVAHPKGTVTYPADTFTSDQIKAFKSDPRLKVQAADTEKNEGNGNGAPSWPPSDDQLASLNHEALGALLVSQGVDPKDLRSKDERRAAIRELVAKQKAGT